MARPRPRPSTRRRSPPAPSRTCACTCEPCLRTLTENVRGSADTRALSRCLPPRRSRFERKRLILRDPRPPANCRTDWRTSARRPARQLFEIQFANRRGFDGKRQERKSSTLRLLPSTLLRIASARIEGKAPRARCARRRAIPAPCTNTSRPKLGEPVGVEHEHRSGRYRGPPNGAVLVALDAQRAAANGKKSTTPPATPKIGGG